MTQPDRGRTRTRRAAFGAAMALIAGAATLVPASLQVGAEATPGSGGFDGDASTTERLAEGHPTYAAIEISRARFDGAGTAGRRAAHAVLSRQDTFADSVAGSTLTGDGPLLFTASDQLSPPTAGELSRVLASGGRVFLLGGTAAISSNVEQQLRSAGYQVQRLAGATRVETAVAVADVVRSLYPGDDVLLARAWGPTGNDTAAWADSVSGGAVAAARRIPILVTPSDALAPLVATWLDRDTPSSTILLGGEAALSRAVANRAPRARRVSGPERTATAAAIATELLGSPTVGDRRFVLTNGALDSGWTYGFASSGMAADARVPVLLVTSVVTDATLSMVRTCGPPRVDLVVVGDGTIVPAPLREQLDVADGHACGPGGAVVYPTNLDAFPDCAALLDFYQESALERVGAYGLGGTGDTGRGGVALPPTVIEGQAEPVGAAPGGATTDSGFSTTNVQEEGVDEPDIVKTDGRHLFSIAGSELRIVRIDDGTPRLAATVALPTDGSHELLLSGSRLLVVTRSFAFAFGGPQPADGPAVGIVAPQPAEQKTRLTAIDVANPSQPVTASSLEIEGDYRSARLIGGVARVVVQSDPAAFPFVYPSEPGAEAEQAAAEHNRGVIEGSTLDDWLPAYTVNPGGGQAPRSAPLLGCSEVRSPPIFSGLGTLSVLTIDLAAGLEPTSQAAVVAAGQTVYASPSRLFVSTSRWGWEPDALDAGVTTEVHGFDISSPTATGYVGSGAVPGYILNQFALSEHNGFLRVATTSQPPWRDSGDLLQTDNGVHVLTEQSGKLVEVGRVRGLGRGEQIYGVRFFADLGAVVTFRQIDPLFLLDLSQPTAPRVTGELKIPGFSAYLHRVGPDRLLGVGSDADAEGRVTGAQVSLFDISNRDAPRLVQAVQYPNASTLVAFDHHAFLHWPATGLVVVPLSEFSRTSTGESGFNGVVGLIAGSGLETAGRASHMEEAADGNGQITRSVVANGTLFTISDAGVEAGDLATLAPRSFLPL